MNQITIPFIEGLDALVGQELKDVLSKKGAVAQVDKLGWPKEFPNKPECSVCIGRGRETLAWMFSVKGPDLRAAALEDGGDVYMDSCCEFFVSTDPDRYCNFEVNCIGTLHAAFGAGRHGRTMFTGQQASQVRRYPVFEHRPMDTRGGIHEWNIALAIPMSLIGLDPDNLPESIRGNFYKCADGTEGIHYLSWNPVLTPSPDFHRPEYFGTLNF